MVDQIDRLSAERSFIEQKEIIMLSKLSVALTATLFVSALATAAQLQSPFPASPNEAGPYQADTYYPPSSIGAPAIAQSSTFPMSVSESGSNYPDVYAAPARTETQPSHTELLTQSQYGSAGEGAAARQTLRVGPSVKFVNVNHFEQVRFVDDKGYSFVWKFDTLDESHFPLKVIAPSSFDAANTVVYVTHPYSHVSTD